MSERMTISCGSIPVGQLVEGVLARVGKVHHIGAATHLAAKALAKKLGDIGFVVDHEDADTHAVLLMCCGVLVAGQANGELGK
jgi:hypothetical protein